MADNIYIMKPLIMAVVGKIFVESVREWILSSVFRVVVGFGRKLKEGFWKSKVV